ncbi:unnamed protein product, partial [Musa hybrid cultivar]
LAFPVSYEALAKRKHSEVPFSLLLRVILKGRLPCDSCPRRFRAKRFGVMMHAPSNKRTAAENGDGGIDVVLMRSLGNGEDLGPIVRYAFECGKPEALLHQLRNAVRKKEVEIEEL